MGIPVTLYTDGGASRNNGPGACAYLLVREVQKEVKSVEKLFGFVRTTPNRMEVMALVEALDYLSEQKRSYDITLVTDSHMLADGLALLRPRSSDKSFFNPLQTADTDLWQCVAQSLGYLPGGSKVSHSLVPILLSTKNRGPKGSADKNKRLTTLVQQKMKLLEMSFGSLDEDDMDEMSKRARIDVMYEITRIIADCRPGDPVFITMNADAGL